MNRSILAKNISGLYAADTVLMSICRQSGKTTDVGGITFADSIIRPGLTTVWTAHRFKVARETFMDMRAIARNPLLSRHIDYNDITTGAGSESIPFLNGSRIVFGARERGSIRGFADVDRLVLDEAQILTEGTMADLAPILNQGWNPQVILMCTPPKDGDPSEVVVKLRLEALSGRSESTLYIEYSSDADADPDSKEATAQANPSYPDQTSQRSIDRMRRLLSDDDYRREGMGIWPYAGRNQVIPGDAWATAGDARSMAVDNMFLGVEVGPDLAWASIALAGKRIDGEWHIELDERRDGAEWVGPYLEALKETNPSLRIVVDIAGPVSSIMEKRGSRWYFKGTMLVARAVRVTELGAGCAQLLAGIVKGTLHHIKQPQMDGAVRTAGKRRLGDTGMWVFSRSNSREDITPIQAAVLALIGAQSGRAQRARGRNARRGSSRRGMILSG